MKIIVCVKQVPVAASMQFDTVTKSLKREGVRTEVSAFDVRAVLKAVELKQVHGGEVVVLTMGPPQARQALVDCLALGADRGVHLCDGAFAGADTLATAQAIAEAIGREPFDLILCGRYSTDAETGQVGPEIAEFLDVAQVTAVRSITIDPISRLLTAERETEDGIETVEVHLPVVVTASEDLAPERFASKSDKLAAVEKPIAEIHAADLGGDSIRFGKAGSPTWVAGVEIVTESRRAEILEAETPEALVDILVQRIVATGIFSTWKVGATSARTESTNRIERAGSREILVVAEPHARGLRPVTIELLSTARALADRSEGTVSLLLFGPGSDASAETAASFGADVILVADGATLRDLAVDPCSLVLEQVLRGRQPGAVLAPSTVFGRDVMPRVAARMRLGLTGDCIDLTWDTEGRLVQHKPAFGGQIVAPILSNTRPEMATVRPGILERKEPRAGRTAEVIALGAPALAGRVRVVSRQTTGTEWADLDAAEVVLGVGQGIGGPENLPAFRDLAAALGGALCTTRDVCDKGWLPKQAQVGLTGKAISPRVYIACGIRGAFEHMVGVRRSGWILAINKNAKAPIFKSSDLGVVAEWQTIIPALTERLRALRT